MASRNSKEQSKQLHEKHQAILSKLLKDDDNKYCVDCDAKGPRWASWNLGVFLCIRCAGIHRNLGVHISKVKSINLDTWTPEQIAMMEDMGNSRARAVYEANLTDNYKRPANSDSSMEQFIRAKYEHKKYIAKEWIPSKPRSAPSHYYDDVQPKKESKKQKPVITVPGAAAGITASKTKEKEKKTPAKKEEPQGSLMVDLSAPEKPAQTKAQTSTDLLTDLFSSQPVTSTAGSNDLLGLSINHQATPNTANTNNTNGTVQSGDDGSQDLFQDKKSQSTKDSIMALYGNSTPQNNMMGGYNMQGSYPPSQVPPQMMYGNGAMMGGVYPQQGNATMMSGYQFGNQSGYYQQPSMSIGNPQPQGMMGKPQPQGMMGNPQPQGMMGQPQQGMMGMMGNPQQNMMNSYPNQQQLYAQQVQNQMANMTLNQQRMPQQVPVMTGNAGASWGSGNAAQTNGQTLNFDLWN